MNARGMLRTIVPCAMALLCGAPAARAEPDCGDPSARCAAGASPIAPPLAQEYGDITGGYAQEETPLTPVEETRPPAPQWDPSVGLLPVPPIIPLRLAEHGLFVQPFVLPAVFPEISARLSNTGGYGSRSRGAELDQLLYLSAYVIDMYAPFLTMRDSSPDLQSDLRVNLKVPLVFGPNAFTLFFGGDLPAAGPWTDGGYNMMFGYALGGTWFSFQARAGFGFDRLISEDAAPRASSVFGDVALDFQVARHIHLLLQSDGRKLLGQQGGTLRLWPGIRYYPFGLATLSIGAGAQVWMDTFTATGVFTTPFNVRRAGAFLDVGYVFF